MACRLLVAPRSLLVSRWSLPCNGTELALPSAKLRRGRQTTYQELAAASRCRFAVLGLEVRGWWSAETKKFLARLALGQAAAGPASQRKAAAGAFARRAGRRALVPERRRVKEARKQKQSHL